MFVREQNTAEGVPTSNRNPLKTRLGIWLRSRPLPGSLPSVSDPLTLRASIRDVAILFVKLRHAQRDLADEQLRVESVVAFGPREKVSGCPITLGDYINKKK